MNTYQLKCAINHDCNMRNAICGVYPADKIPRTLRMCKGFIVNTDPHQKPGKHWIVFFYDGHRIVVLDDLMMGAANSDEIVHLMCIGSHHHQITVIHILQNLFQNR